jgi:hypothetical protein
VSLVTPRCRCGVASDPQAAQSQGRRVQRTASGYTPDPLAPRFRLMPLPLPVALTARPRRCAPAQRTAASPSPATSSARAP